MTNFKIRNVSQNDFKRIVELNSSEVESTSEMDLEKVTDLDALAVYHKAIVIDGEVEGFLLAIPSGRNYVNENYSWFSSRYEQFHYIDRIVVSSSCYGKGLGSALYSDLFSFSKSRVNTIACEYNLEPLNTASKALHLKYGFTEVGRHFVSNEKLVSLQVKET